LNNTQDFYIILQTPSSHAELVSASQTISFCINENRICLYYSNKWRTTFYIGVTADLARRVAQHKMGKGSEFTGENKLTDLVYYERIGDIEQAIKREKQLKRWHRDWKINLIKSVNPEMKDLSETGLERLP
jgi:putative endonuclease